MFEVWTYEWTNITWISHLLINMCVKCVFNAWYQCVKPINYEWNFFAWLPLLSYEMFKFVMIHHKSTRTIIKDESIWPSTLGKWYVIQLHTLSFHVWPPQPSNNNTPKGRTFCTFKITNPTITYNIINLVYYKYK
jgi:hypothetical protein